ncbi:alpha-ketoglutarate-dependent dioxygenase AlkB [Dactylosporangium sp. CA-092794]|uniref:alpha-ketoglutarate-dependent dioxygenase AlkB n=1 Tax=Dactylosporangium sp. CA-092794 TaxID=3239929 RepID=UPI003D943C7A
MSEVPGLRYTPEWITPEEERALLTTIDAAEWSTELRRRVQHYGMRYDYTSRAVAPAARTPLPDWAAKLGARLSFVPDQVIVNEYLPGQGISAHTDCVPCFGPEVAAVSLGSGCTMEFSNDLKVPVHLAARSLCVMSGPSRYEWRHAIAARKSDPAPDGTRVPRGRRVSVTFRTVLGSATP